MYRVIAWPSDQPTGTQTRRSCLSKPDGGKQLPMVGLPGMNTMNRLIGDFLSVPTKLFGTGTQAIPWFKGFMDKIRNSA